MHTAKKIMRPTIEINPIQTALTVSIVNHLGNKN
jgi:hypothetical protein